MVIKRNKLTDEVSVQEMQEYRRQGMTNKEIAKLLDVSDRTIYNYLGPNSGKPRKKRGPRTEKEVGPLTPEQYDACKAHIEAKKAGQPSQLAQKMFDDIQAKKAEKAEKVPGRIETTNIICTIRGRVGEYSTNQLERTVEMNFGMVTFDQLRELIADLTEIKEGLHV